MVENLSQEKYLIFPVDSLRQSRTKLNGTPCHLSEKRLFLPPFPLFNVAVVLSRTSTYMLTYNIDLGDGG